jgi:hypothetical protein
MYIAHLCLNYIYIASIYKKINEFITRVIEWSHALRFNYIHVLELFHHRMDIAWINLTAT